MISEITENQIQRDGRRYVTYQYTFPNGDMVHFYSMSKPGDYDVEAGLVEYGALAKKQVIEQDDDKLVQQIEGGLNPLDAEPAYPDTMSLKGRKKRLLRKVLGRIAAEEDLRLVRKLFYPIWHWLKFESGYTAQQIAGYLGISVVKLQKVNARFQRLHDHLALIDEDEAIEGIVEEVGD